MIERPRCEIGPTADTSGLGRCAALARGTARSGNVLLDIARDCRIFFAVPNSHLFDRFPGARAGKFASSEEKYG